MRCDADAPVAHCPTLERLRLQDLRCLPSAELTLHPRLNLITGNNGAGKTTLLEAVYLLGRGRSFRTRQSEQLIRSGRPRMAVAGTVRTQAGPELEREYHLGIHCGHEAGLEARVNERVVQSLAELAALLPIQVLDPGIHRLIEEGPALRRSWLDWAMFHVEPQFLLQWRGYRRALQQRNAALRSGADATLWDRELARFGEPLTSSRAQLIEAIQPHWHSVLRALDAPPATLRFNRGWSSSEGLADCLSRQLARDRERGLTGQGPHHFDIVLRLEGGRARDRVSRGQQKLLGAAMGLSMGQLLGHRLGRPPVLLLDDPAAELDAAHTQALLTCAASLGGQQIATALRAEVTSLGAPDALFHVERGEVKRL